MILLNFSQVVSHNKINTYLNFKAQNLSMIFSLFEIFYSVLTVIGMFLAGSEFWKK